MMTMDTINSSRGWLLEATVLLWNIIIDYIDFAMSKSREMLYVKCNHVSGVKYKPEYNQLLVRYEFKPYFGRREK